MRQIVSQHHAFSQIDLVDGPAERGDEVGASLDRFREQSFFAEECLDMLAAAREDPKAREIFKRSGYRQAWLQDINHQRELLEQMCDVLLSWETVGRASTDAAPCACR